MTLKIGLLASAVLIGFVGVTVAAGNEPSPYAGYEARKIKALSGDEIKGLLAGDGLAASLPAELNGFPGPRHVIDMAGELGLTESQRARAADIAARMKSTAVALGARIVTLEAELDRRFAEGRIDSDSIDRLAAEIGAARGALRAAHLQAHYAMADALTADQRKQYMALRGYGADTAASHMPGSGHRRH